MNTWIALSPEDAHHKYKIPWYIAKAKGNSFFGTNPMPGTPYHDGPWPLVALLAQDKIGKVVTFQTCTVEDEYIDDVEAPNPLNERLGGRLGLRKQQFVDLIHLLKDYASHLEDPLELESVHTQFQLIEHDELSKYYQYKESPPGSDTFHYLQLYDPAPGRIGEDITTIVILSAQEPYNLEGRSKNVPLKFGIEFHKFLNSEIQDPFFSLTSPRVSKIDLDKQGILKLVRIMEEVLTFSNQ